MPIDRGRLGRGSTPEALANFLAAMPAGVAHEHGEGGAVETVREDEFQGHRIVVRTTYRLEVDGRTIDAPLMVDNDGRLHCHSLPNYQFASAIELVRQLIKTFPGEFPASEPPQPPPAGGGHGHGH